MQKTGKLRSLIKELKTKYADDDSAQRRGSQHFFSIGYISYIIELALIYLIKYIRYDHRCYWIFVPSCK